ncbi:MAG: chemotaxis protein CheA, partial [Chthoniobacterales bacterium]|nr:chemotaxis protein CheA [Chthoniobacterales bacterium]
SVLPSYLLQFNIDPIIVRDGLRHGRNFFVLELRLHADIENQNQTILEFFNELDSLGDIIATSTDVGLEACTGLQEEIRPDLICSVFFCTPMEDTLLLGAFNLPPSTITPVPKEPLQEWIRTQPKLVPSQYSTKHQIQEEPTPPRSHQVHESKLVPVTQAKSRDDNKLIPTTPPSQEITPATLQTRPHQPQSQDKTEPTTNIQSFRIKTEETVRLNVSILDTLMNLAGEMVVGRNKLVRCAEAGLGPDSIGELQAIVQQISTVTSDLQRTVMAARLQPVGNLFGKFNRIVRDLGQKLHKEIRLEILGEDVELDRTLLEGLSDPLTHLVRNAADHGLEPPEERRAAGKPPVGRIRLAAAHFHGRVQIEVRDDGRGLNPQKIRNKAVERGIISAEAAARMSDQEACRLIFMPGFSTASTVTDISGRGVGMDVVKTNIEKLGGTVDLESEPGRGTAVIIRLPLTLAIIPALIVSCGGRRFAMPQINVEEIVAPGPDYPLEILGGAQVLRLRNELVPILDLAHILGQKRTKEQDQAQRFALIIGLDHARYGLLVDEIDNMEEIVVKPLGRLLKGVPWYSGATLLGQGDIALILEPAALAEGRLPQDGIQDVEVTKSQSSISQESHAQRILVFRDGTHERFAIPLSVISRVERVPSSRIERIGSKECLRQADNRSTLQLLRVANYIPVTPPPDYEEEVYVIVPRLVHHAIGIMASEIVDSADIYPGQIDSSVVSAPGLLGTATVL